MFPLKTCLKNYIETSRRVITRPRQFYREMPVSGSFKEPIGFAALTIFIQSMLYVSVLIAFWAPLMPLHSSLGFTIIAILVLFLYFLFSILTPFFIYSILLHLLLIIGGAKGSIETTFRVMCYYFSTFYLTFPFTLIFLMLSYLIEVKDLQNYDTEILATVNMWMLLASVFYSLYILFAGFSEVHHISMKRVVLVTVGIPAALIMLLAALVLGLTFLTEQSGQYDPDITFPRSNLTALNGTPPIIDGYLTPKDGWDENQQIYQVSKQGDAFSLAAKHDSENLYILVKWQAKQGASFSNIYFEQDGTTHDHNLTTGRYDKKHNSHANDYRDEYGSLPVYLKQSGTSKCNYENGYYVYEWLVPLRTGYENDIYVDELPSTLGFMVEMINVNRNGFWPYNASKECGPGCWGHLEIVP